MIDLHAHSTASDGTLTPAELMRAAAAAGLDVVALTDHDTTAGWAPAAAALPAGLTLVPGAELSCRWFGADPRIPLHLLGERYRVPKKDLDVFAALALVRGAGGVAVFAHPRATRRGRTVPDSLIVELAAAGLFGLEADHDDHSPAERAHVRALAASLGLVATGSSDFHGANKTVRLGANTTDPGVYAAIVAAASGYAPLGEPADLG